jgi:four helix bundle protein
MSYKVTMDRSAPREQHDTKPRSFQTFEDLDVCKAAREFRKAMYGVARSLPEIEKFELGRPIRRAAVSLTNNIAEGHGRFHYPDQIRFFLHSRGSLEELVDDLNVRVDECYLSADGIGRLKDQSQDVLNLINGYLRYLRGRSASVREGNELEPTDGIDDVRL